MKYVTLSNIKRDGVMIAPGQLLELTDSEAEPMLSAAAIKPTGKPTAFTVRASAPRPEAVFSELSAPHRN